MNGESEDSPTRMENNRTAAPGSRSSGDISGGVGAMARDDQPRCITLELMPMLRQFNPGIDVALAAEDCPRDEETREAEGGDVPQVLLPGAGPGGETIP